MRQTKSLLILALMGGALAFTSCKKEDFTSDAVTTTLKAGSWKITSYKESKDDHSSDFTGYIFTFNADGTALAVKGTDSTSGTWSSSDNNDDNSAHLTLNFGAADPLKEIADDWHVTDQTSVLISLEDVSGGNGGTDVLKFEKQ